MTSELQIFTNEEFGKVRTLSIDGQPWAVGKDVAEILGYVDTVNALKTHVDDDEKAGWRITTQFGEKETTIINESGIYSLIFNSQLPKAKAFKRWVTHDVLPAIRKTGEYKMPIQEVHDTDEEKQAVLDQCAIYERVANAPTTDEGMRARLLLWVKQAKENLANDVPMVFDTKEKVLAYRRQLENKNLLQGKSEKVELLQESSEVAEEEDNSIQVTVYKSRKFGEIRTFSLDGVVWSAGKDVANFFEYADAAKALERIVKAEDKYPLRKGDFRSAAFAELFAKDKTDSLLFVNDDGVYNLAINSSSSQLSKLRRWLRTKGFAKV